MHAAGPLSHFGLLNRLFEPYVIHVIGKLLNCYSDSARLVRDGAHAAARAIMANLSGQGQSSHSFTAALSKPCQASKLSQEMPLLPSYSMFNLSLLPSCSMSPNSADRMAAQDEQDMPRHLAQACWLANIVVGQSCAA